MSYKIISQDTGNLVLERKSAGWMMFAFIMGGALFFGIGLVINSMNWGDSPAPLLFRILFPTMGLGAILAGINIPRIHRKTIPELIIFDNHKGVVSVHMSKDGDQVGYIRYEEIEKFDLQVEERRSSSTSSGKLSSSTTYYYHVLLRKKNGSEWYLIESGSKKFAEEMIQRLRTSVHLEVPCSLRISTVLTDKLIKEESRSKTILKWENKVSPFAFLFILLFAVVFLSVLYSIVVENNRFNDFDAFLYLIAGFIFCVFCFVMFTVIRKMIKNASSLYKIVIDKDNFEYHELTKTSETIKKTKSIALKDIYGISYSFIRGKNDGNTGLSVLTKNDYDRIQSYKNKPLQAVKDFFTGKDTSVKLDITALNPVECLQLETWLQEVIKRKIEAGQV